MWVFSLKIQNKRKKCHLQFALGIFAGELLQDIDF